MAEARIEALVDAWQAAWSDRDSAAFMAICHPELHYEDPTLAYPLESVAALREHAQRLWVAFPDVRLETLGQRLADAHFVVAPCRATGTNRGPLGGLPATERSVTLGLICYCELDGARARLLRVRVFFDRYDAAMQLGVLPSHGTFGERAMMALRGFGLRAR